MVPAVVNGHDGWYNGDGVAWYVGVTDPRSVENANPGRTNLPALHQQSHNQTQHTTSSDPPCSWLLRPK